MTEPNTTETSPPADGAEADTELKDLREKLAAAEQARDEFKDQALRTRAEFENYQKRAQRDNALVLRYAEMPLAFDLLAALDNLERAVAAAKQVGETGPLVQGVAMVQALILDVFRRHGISRIDALGKPFDPNLHQAVMQQATADHPPGTVAQVLEQGYLIHDRVLRPARVAVSTAP
jgi:molecular chaperone GrpE